MTHATHKLKGGKLVYNLPHNSLERIKDVLVKVNLDNELEDQELFLYFPSLDMELPSNLVDLPLLQIVT
jgi:hypothetical protein